MPGSVIFRQAIRISCSCRPQSTQSLLLSSPSTGQNRPLPLSCCGVTPAIQASPSRWKSGSSPIDWPGTGLSRPRVLATNLRPADHLPMVSNTLSDKYSRCLVAVYRCPLESWQPLLARLSMQSPPCLSKHSLRTGIQASK